FHAETWSNESLRPRKLEQWRSYIDDALEAVLPVAERCGVIVALENIWTEIASPEELNGFVKRFSSPWLGLCFDAGHANVMSASGK
ncbi:MAG: TIM barrel protein, partial [Victivallales bacterium]|nr:TIM barrel protein [Victivallales bacterium]